jgi:gamma-glutamylcysteine synthetase
MTIALRLDSPPEQWRIGTEHEKFERPLPWDGPQGIEAC